MPAKLQALNNAINQGIDDAASASHVPLVDVHAIFHGIASGNPSDPYFRLSLFDQSRHCCTLGFLWGVSSFDGIHPSNTGYALVAYAFIDAINKAYGTHIPQIDLKAATRAHAAERIRSRINVIRIPTHRRTTFRTTLVLVRRRLVLDLLFEDLVAATIEPLADLGLYVVGNDGLSRRLRSSPSNSVSSSSGPGSLSGGRMLFLPKR